MGPEEWMAAIAYADKAYRVELARVPYAQLTNFELKQLGVREMFLVTPCKCLHRKSQHGPRGGCHEDANRTADPWQARTCTCQAYRPQEARDYDTLWVA